LLDIFVLYQTFAVVGVVLGEAFVPILTHWVKWWGWGWGVGSWIKNKRSAGFSYEMAVRIGLTVFLLLRK